MPRLRALLIHQVKDAHCIGTILDGSDIFEIDFKPRPHVDLVPAPSIIDTNGTFSHKGLCAGEEEQVALRFKGAAPFEVKYRHTHETPRSPSTSTSTLKSAQDTGILHLDTEPGRHHYEFTDLRDANYANTPVSISLIHEVHDRPSVSFVRGNSRPLCLDSTISSDARVRFQGKAPFTLNLAVRKPGSAEIVQFPVVSETHEWALDLPFVTTEIGRHEISIVGMSDSGGCEWIVHDQDRLSTVVEVVESARIVPITQVEDLCIGDRLDFLLQGKAPWTIE